MGENPLSAIIVVSLLLRALMFMYTMEHDAHRSTWENFLAFHAHTQYSRELYCKKTH